MPTMLTSKACLNVKTAFLLLLFWTTSASAQQQNEPATAALPIPIVNSTTEDSPVEKNPASQSFNQSSGGEIQNLRQKFGRVLQSDDPQQQAEADAVFKEYLDKLQAANPISNVINIQLPQTNNEKVACLRQAAGLLEQQAAIMETHRLYQSANDLRDQAHDLWLKARVLETPNIDLAIPAENSPPERIFPEKSLPKLTEE